jgi:hypothetical protein
MALIKLVHQQGSHHIIIVPLINKCDLVMNNPKIIISSYQVQYGVSLPNLHNFVSALYNKRINIKDKNFPGLAQLSGLRSEQLLSLWTVREMLPNLFIA